MVYTANCWLMCDCIIFSIFQIRNLGCRTVASSRFVDGQPEPSLILVFAPCSRWRLCSAQITSTFFHAIFVLLLALGASLFHSPRAPLHLRARRAKGIYVPWGSLASGWCPLSLEAAAPPSCRMYSWPPDRARWKTLLASSFPGPAPSLSFWLSLGTCFPKSPLHTDPYLRTCFWWAQFNRILFPILVLDGIF